MKKSFSKSHKVPFYKKKQFLTIIIGVFFIMLMALSAVNIGLHNSEEGYEDTVVTAYNGMEFVQSELGWETLLPNGQRIAILSYPETLTPVESFDFSIFSLSSKVYLSANPHQDVQYALYDLDRNIALPQSVQACTEDNDLCSDLPLITCADASRSVGVIVLEEAEEDAIFYEDNCLTIHAKDLLNVVDSLIIDYYA